MVEVAALAFAGVEIDDAVARGAAMNAAARLVRPDEAPARVARHRDAESARHAVMVSSLPPSRKRFTRNAMREGPPGVRFCDEAEDGKYGV